MVAWNEGLPVLGKREEFQVLWFEPRKGTLAAPDCDSCSRMCMDVLVVLLLHMLIKRQVTGFQGFELTG